VRNLAADRNPLARAPACSSCRGRAPRAAAAALRTMARTLSEGASISTSRKDHHLWPRGAPLKPACFGVGPPRGERSGGTGWRRLGVGIAELDRRRFVRAALPRRPAARERIRGWAALGRADPEPSPTSEQPRAGEVARTTFLSRALVEDLACRKLSALSTSAGADPVLPFPAPIRTTERVDAALSASTFDAGTNLPAAAHRLAPYHLRRSQRAGGSPSHPFGTAWTWFASCRGGPGNVPFRVRARRDARSGRARRGRESHGGGAVALGWAGDHRWRCPSCARWPKVHGPLATLHVRRAPGIPAAPRPGAARTKPRTRSHALEEAVDRAWAGWCRSACAHLGKRASGLTPAARGTARQIRWRESRRRGMGGGRARSAQSGWERPRLRLVSNVERSIPRSRRARGRRSWRNDLAGASRCARRSRRESSPAWNAVESSAPALDAMAEPDLPLGGNILLFEGTRSGWPERPPSGEEAEEE